MVGWFEFYVVVVVFVFGVFVWFGGFWRLLL